MIQGQLEGAVLTAKGRRQIVHAAKSFERGQFDAIVSSDLRRAVESATIFAEALDLSVSVDASLRERSFGDLEGSPSSYASAELWGIDGNRVLDDQARPTNGESLHQLLDRVGHFVERIRSTNTGQQLLVVTHGGTIRAIRAYCAGTSFKGAEWYPVANASTWPIELVFN